MYQVHGPSRMLKPLFAIDAGASAPLAPLRLNRGDQATTATPAALATASKMDALRGRLRAVARSLPCSASGSTAPAGAVPPSRLVQLSPRWHLLLAADGSLHTLLVSGGPGAVVGGGGALQLSALLPPDAHSLVPSRLTSPRVAVVGEASVAVVTVDVHGKVGAVGRVAAGLFANRPGLRVMQAAWHPRAEDYLMVLTSDGSLRLYDVAAGGDVEGERLRLRIVTTGDAPTGFAFGKGSGWDALAVYVLTEGGAIYVASPVAPVGTLLSYEHWCAMWTEANAVLSQHGGAATPGSQVRTATNVLIEDSSQPASVSSGKPPSGKALAANGVTAATTSTKPSTRTPRQQLEFGRLDDDEDSADDGSDNDSSDSASRRSRRSRALGSDRGAVSMASRVAPAGEDNEDAPWAVRQAQLQRRFLERAFEQTDAGDMLMMREFKPAPLLFQGPLFVERDDVGEGAAGGILFTSLTVLDSGPAVPLILLRCSSDGKVSVLVGMEPVEGQWFISEDLFGTTGDGVIAANEEYARSASIVAPALLCFEHIEFPSGEPVCLHPVRGKGDFDVLFARVGAAVFSVRLTFVAAIRNPSTLRSTSSSMVAPLLSTAKLGGDLRDSQSAIVGLAPLFQKDLGPLAIAVTGSYSLEATAPLRWMTDASDDDLPESLLSGVGGIGLDARGESPLPGEPSGTSLVGGAQFGGGSNSGLPRGKAQSGAAVDVAEALAAVRSGRNVQTWALGAGSVGSVREATCVTDVLNCVETRVIAYSGGDNGAPGLCDHLKSLAVLVPKWAGEVSKRARGANRGISLVKGESEARGTEAEALKVKLRRAVELNENLRARVDTLRQLHQARQFALSPAEVARHAKLKERRRSVAAMRRKIEEVSAAVRSINLEVEAASKRRFSTSSTMRPLGVDNSIGSFSGSPLLNRRASTSVYGAGGRLSGDGGGTVPNCSWGDLTAAQLQRIKEALAQQSASIVVATGRAQALWEKFASV